MSLGSVPLAEGRPIFWLGGSRDAEAGEDSGRREGGAGGVGWGGVHPKSETASQGTKYIEWSEVWICPDLSTVAI